MAAKDLLRLGTRAAVDQTLSRSARRGSVIRVGRGLYVRPVEGRLGVRPPEPETVVQAIVEQRGESAVPRGAAAANELGLTTQVPVREVRLTSGPARKLKLANQVIELRHAPAFRLALLGRQAGALIRALAWLGPKLASHAIEAVRGEKVFLEYVPLAAGSGYVRPVVIVEFGARACRSGARACRRRTQVNVLDSAGVLIDYVAAVSGGLRLAPGDKTPTSLVLDYARVLNGGLLHDGNKVVEVYDYVDADVLMLARMYRRRLKGYEHMGYKVLSDAQRRLDL